MVCGIIIHSSEVANTVFYSYFYNEENESTKYQRQDLVVKDVEEQFNLIKRRHGNKEVLEGIFQLDNELFTKSKIVLWCKVNNIIYTIICDEDENRALAMHTLPVLAKVLTEQHKVVQGHELLMRPDELFILLQSYIPNGQLMFISPNLSKHIKKESEALLK